MALMPGTMRGKDRLSPGANGEQFQADLPGYRNSGSDRINRSNNHLFVGPHDVPPNKYMLDYRLPVLFTYGFTHGFNRMVIPKGRVVALDPYMSIFDTDMKVAHNTVTIANGGAPVKIRSNSDLYRAETTPAVTDLVEAAAQGKALHGIAKEWAPMLGMTDSYSEKCYRPLATKNAEEQLADGGYAIKSDTGRIYKNNVEDKTVRAGNIPMGIIERNEYTRYEDAFNGMTVGAILTDAIVELPWFAYKNKAEQNVWGSAYGNLTPGCLVKSDENGRMTVSPLSYPDVVKTMNLDEYEAERQQIIGQVYECNRSLLPEGAAVWATWTLDERLNFDEFNPEVYPQNNRGDEDVVGHTPYQSTGEYPGYPYDKAYTENNLHMLASAGRLDNYDKTMDIAYQYENLGIPGLTDGKNVAVSNYGPELIGRIRYAGGKDYVAMKFKLINNNVEEKSIQLSIGGEAFTNAAEGITLEYKSQEFLQISYLDEKQGILVFAIIDKAVADTLLEAAPNHELEIKATYKKRGLAGVPTFMDWDGCVGSVRVLLQK